MLDGLSERLEKELPKILDYDVNVAAYSDRKYAAWIGGSLFSSMAKCHQTLTKNDYDEDHEIVHKMFGG
eukprot:CAMPEP_0168344510 /NCGR_PEP_ID=MMETSP0213-20121227/16874_1 /TAXON_ID=151035 /ORGANISM="Euplotes harpa, Strain FSP1.4" /LENGTH=68 /DNA_ID=CAMNT_0008352295 /DNA_START=261 /DNA_END=463 /DNA_ORIENTATION=-